MTPENYQDAMQTTDYRTFAHIVAKGCTRCSLSEHEGNYPVIYRGNPDSKILLIGEAPGLNERIKGQPFTGPAGELLDKIFGAIGLDTNQHMVISNCVFCRPVAPSSSPKQNYTPKSDQIARCWPFVQKSIDLLDPRIIIACGRPALHQIMEDNSLSMKDFEGRWLNKNGRKVFVTMHPAAVLHKAQWPEEQREMKRRIWTYMQYYRDTWKEKFNG